MLEIRKGRGVANDVVYVSACFARERVFKADNTLAVALPPEGGNLATASSFVGVDAVIGSRLDGSMEHALVVIRDVF